MDKPMNDWLDWNPMAEHFYDAESNKYDCVNIAPVEDKDKKDRSSKQMQYPYLVIKKKNSLITDTMLRNFFGDAIIYDIEYRTSSRVFFVYFHNIGSIEAARTKIRQSPNIVDCVEGRPKPVEFHSHPEKESEEYKTLEPMSSADELNAVDLLSRTIEVSTGQDKHPVFYKAPLIIKADYAKNPLLAANDINLRYLNVKDAFNLERHGAYPMKNKVDKDRTVIQYRFGRLIVTPQSQLEMNEPKDTESKLAQVASKCLACGCYTDNSCKFCKMPFCNPGCFEALAAVHKESCEKGRPPVIDDTIMQQFAKIKLPPSGASVKITAFEQTHVLYVRSADIICEVAYYKVLSDVMIRGKTMAKLKELPQIGQIVIYKFDTQIVRAMVLNIDNPLAIYFVCVDYGNVEITSLENLHECSAYLTSLPRYAIPVLLRGVPKRYMLPNLREMMYELDQTYTFVLKYSQREFDFDKGMQRVVLIESDMNRSLNRLLKTILTPIEPLLSDAGLKEDYLQHMHLPTGKGIDMVVIDNTLLKFGVIYCTILELAYDITRMQRDFQYYGESVAKPTHYAPPKDELCIAKYHGKWCRGLCMELVGDGHPSILFIDYGNIVPISVDDIRPYPPQFTYPVLTTEYDLIGFPEGLSDNSLERVKKHLATGATVKCDEIIYNKLDNNYSMRIDAIDTLLKP